MKSRGVLFLLSFLLAAAALAAEGKEEKLSADQTQQRYTRKSITYLGMWIGPAVMRDADYLATAEKIIRSKIELPRFDYNAVSLTESYSLDDFVNNLREYVKKRAYDRAAAEAEFEARFKSNRVYFDDVDRIMNSAYLYQIKLSLLSVERGKCPDSKVEALLLGCIPGAEGMIARVNASVTFYQANLTQEGAPPYKLIKEVAHIPTVGFEELALEILANPEQLPAAMKSAGMKATAEAANFLGEFLSKGMKQIPDFQLKTPVQAALSDGVEFMMGKQEGVRMDETYDVAEFDAAGDKTLLGYVKVRKIGDASGEGGGNPSYAEKVKEKRKLVGGEQLFEHPMINLAVGLSFIFEFAAKDVLGATDSSGSVKSGFYPGVGLYVDYDLAPIINIPELYVSVETDFLYIPNDSDLAVYLIHGLFGIKKKWYIESLVLAAGLRGGISYYQVENYEDDSLGFGADAYLGLEYYFKPEFSIFAKVGGRFFTNPLQMTVDLDPEMGAFAQMGAFLAF
jgi:hypothetical protein